MTQKLKHNKKRNTAFLFEVLARELTKSIVNENREKKNKIISILRKYFQKDFILAKDLECYKTLSESKGLNLYTAEKLLQEIKGASRLIDPQGLFVAQSNLIKTVNTTLSKSVFDNFVPNYKTLATISQIFDKSAKAKTRVLLEEVILKRITSKEKDLKENMAPVDNLIYHTFVEKFNTQYKDSLLEEQKKLFTNYILSFSDNGVGLKIFLNEELGRLREKIKDSLGAKEIKSDKRMIEKTNQVLGLINEFKEQPITDSMIKDILKIQNLAHEICK